jgi:hypothetical protein
MTNPNFAPDSLECHDSTDGRRQELRALLVSAADAARQGRRISALAGRLSNPIGRAIRDRIAMLLAAAN